MPAQFTIIGGQRVWNNTAEIHIDSHGRAMIQRRPIRIYGVTQPVIHQSPLPYFKRDDDGGMVPPVAPKLPPMRGGV
ncbi:MAG: hypothetical protein AAFM92_03080 [Pseudomonadota bacterium]